MSAAVKAGLEVPEWHLYISRMEGRAAQRNQSWQKKLAGPQAQRNIWLERKEGNCCKCRLIQEAASPTRGRVLCC